MLLDVRSDVAFLILIIRGERIIVLNVCKRALHRNERILKFTYSKFQSASGSKVFLEQLNGIWIDRMC